MSSSSSVNLDFVWNKILGQRWSGTCSIYLWVPHGQPSWCLVWWQPGVSFQPCTYRFPSSCWNFSLLFPTTTNTLKSFMLEARSERRVKPSNGWGTLPWSASLQRKICRIQALKGCADARKVLQAQVFIHICSHGWLEPEALFLF